MTKQSIQHFQNLTQCHRALYTMTLLVFGVAYLVALIQTYSVHAGRDGEPGLSANDLELAYSGTHEATRLESAIRGPMSGMLDEEDVVAIIDWIHAGAKEADFNDRVAGIIEEHCLGCHAKNSMMHKSNPHIPGFESYSKLKKMVYMDTGADVLTLIRVSHIHLFGMTFIFFIVGGIFLHARVRPEILKCIILITPFIAIILDIFSWYLTKLYQPFSWVIYISGFCMALAFAAQWIISVYQMWFYKLPPGHDGVSD